MKKKSFLLSLPFLLILAACGSKKSELIVGNWKFESVTFHSTDKEIPEDLRIATEAQLKQMNEEMKKGYSWNVKNDGSFIATFQGKDYKGKWSLNKDQTIIVTDKGDGAAKDSSFIDELTPNKLSFHQKDKQGRTTTTTFLK